jgi:hypothetical protein
MVALRPGGIHAVVHLAGDGLELADLLVPGGRIASTLGLSGDQLNGRAVQVTPVMALPVSRILGRLAADVVYGQLTVPVQRTYALANIPRALADFAAGTGNRRAFGRRTAVQPATAARRRAPGKLCRPAVNRPAVAALAAVISLTWRVPGMYPGG